jgi:transposase InsO family protein
MNKFRPPEPLTFEGNISEQWDQWKQQFELYITATESDDKTDNTKTSILLTCIGKQGLEIYNTFVFRNDGDKMKLKPVMEKFEAYCKPRKNITLIRHHFFTYKQGEGQTFDAFITELKKRSSQCEFGTLRDSLIRDMVVIGVLSNSLRERLLRMDNLSLEDAIKLGQAAEATKKHASELCRSQENHTIDALKQSKHNNKPRMQNQASNANEYISQPCKYCGSLHKRRNRPAFGKTCLKCKKLNHFASVCLSTQKRVDFTQIQPQHESDNEDFFIGVVKQSEQHEDTSDTDSFEADGQDWFISLQSNGSKIKYKIDTGAQTNILPLSVYNQLNIKPTLEKTNVKLSAYNGGDIPAIGKCELRLESKTENYEVAFIVTDTESPPLLGLQTCQQLNIIKRIWVVDSSEPNFMEQYEDVFGELGCLQGEHHIVTKPEVKPVIHPSRKIPISMMDKLKAERMKQLDVIEKIDEPTDWVSSLVIVEKPDGKIRLCLDPRDLNKAIKRQLHPMPTVDEILSKLGGAKVFSKLDASSGYWQIKVDDESSKLLTFNTPFGRHRFKRLPFGIHSAAEVFQKKISEIISDVQGTANDQDDIIVFGKDKEEHDEALKQVLDRVRESKLKLNKKKCTFRVTETTFLGHLISADGIKPDPRKIEAILKMPTLDNKTQLQRFLGMINYLGKFLPNLSKETAPLRQLLEKDVQWHFEQQHEGAVNTLKKMITSSPVLAYYESKLPTRLTTDASKAGLGAVLEQKHEGVWKPIAYASRAMTQCEQHYAQIEKETLAIVFACERFHEYTYGKRVIVRTDHKPLRAIFSKPINKAPPRIQRFLLRLQQYDLEVQFTPGSEIPVADTLSRAYLTQEVRPEVPEQEIRCHVHFMIKSLPVSPSKLDEFKRETAKDESLQKLKQFIQEGWPDDKDKIPDAVKPYLTYQDEISEAEGLMLRGCRIIVPTSMRKEMKIRIHEGHLGIERCKARAREALYWPGMSSQITEMIARCSTCLEARRKHQREPMQQFPPATEPWRRVGTDLFKLQGKDYLLVVDYHTNYPEISLLPNTTSSTVIKHTKSIFARHGIPNVVISDNGPQYACKEYEEFARKWEFQHITSSPYHPEANGKAERTVQTIKSLMKKASKDEEDPYLALLNFRASPSPERTPAPAAMLMNRNVRTRLPGMKGEMSQWKGLLLERQQKQKQYYDAKTKPLDPLAEGSTVRIRRGNGWDSLAKVMKQADTPRSYIIQEKTGRKLRRNRRDLLHTDENFTMDSPEHSGDEEVEIMEPAPSVEQTTAVVQGTSTGCPTPLTNQNSPYRTRSGRSVKPPAWLQEFEHK